MNKIYQLEPGIIALEISETINAEGMNSLLQTLFDLTDNVDNARMLYRIYNLKMPTLRALGVEMSQLPQLFNVLRKTDRIAVITEHSWIRTAAEVEGAVIPGVAINAYAPDDESDALDWLRQA